MRRFILTILLLLSGAAAANAQTTVGVKFNDESEIQVSNFYRGAGKAGAIKSITNKKFTAELYTIGKAGKVFDDETLQLLKKKSPSLAKKIGKITTAYQMKQPGAEFGFAVFDSVNYDNFRSCVNKSLPCKIECDAVIISLEENGATKNILIIKTIQKINN